MLKPHLLWTILVFAILGGLIVRFAAQQDWSWSNRSNDSKHKHEHKWLQREG